MIVYFLKGKHFQRHREHDILLPLSIMGVYKKTNQKFIVDECAGHVTLFSIQAFVSELAALAINQTTCSDTTPSCTTTLKYPALSHD